jgi:hypothetical protein
MYGVVKGVYYCNIETNEELNNRISERNIPSAPLQPQFSSRAVSTKYSMLPIFDRRVDPSVPIDRQPTYNVSDVFNPGNAGSPWSGFASNINKESSLRNQFFALQKCGQSSYIPSSSSDMYNVVVSGRNERQPFPELFKEQKFNSFNPNTCEIGKDMFNNFTREQLLDK